MTAGPARPRWHKALAAFALSTGSIYVAGNLLVANVVTLGYRLQVTVEVVDGTTNAPIAGASIRWYAADGMPLGTTAADGRVVGEIGVQQMPLWVWPAIGPLQLHGTLHATAAGYAPTVVDLGKALPELTVGHPVGTVRVALGR